MTDFPDNNHGTFCMGLAAARINQRANRTRGDAGALLKQS